MDISAAAAVSWSRGTTRGIDASSDGRWSAAIAIISAVATYGGQTAGMWYQRVQHEKSRTAGEAGLARDDQPAAVEPVREHPAVQAKPRQRQQFHRAKQPTATVDPVSCRAWTSRATSVASVPSAVTVRLAYSSRKSREVRSGVRSARSLGLLNAARAVSLPWRGGVVQARRRRYGLSHGPATPFGLAPDVVGDLDDQFELGHFLVVAEHVALDRRGEAALRRQA